MSTGVHGHKLWHSYLTEVCWPYIQYTNYVMSKVQRTLPVLKTTPVSGLADQVYGRVQRSSGRHSFTRDHLVSEGLWELGSGEHVEYTRVGSK